MRFPPWQIARKRHTGCEKVSNVLCAGDLGLPSFRMMYIFFFCRLREVKLSSLVQTLPRGSVEAVACKMPSHMRPSCNSGIILTSYSMTSQLTKLNQEVQYRIHKGSPRIPTQSRINPLARIDTYFSVALGGLGVT